MPLGPMAMPHDLVTAAAREAMGGAGCCASGRCHCNRPKVQNLGSSSKRLRRRLGPHDCPAVHEATTGHNRPRQATTGQQRPRQAMAGRTIKRQRRRTAMYGVWSVATIQSVSSARTACRAPCATPKAAAAAAAAVAVAVAAAAAAHLAAALSARLADSGPVLCTWRSCCVAAVCYSAVVRVSHISRIDEGRL